MRTLFIVGAIALGGCIHDKEVRDEQREDEARTEAPAPTDETDRTAPEARSGCGRDTDCKGARICTDGRCVDPPASQEARAAPASAGQQARVPKSWLGLVITYDTLSSTDVSSPGVLVETVFADTPAQKAGLQVGDRLLAVNGEPVQSVEGFQRREQEGADQPMGITLQRNGDRMTVAIHAASFPMYWRSRTPEQRAEYVHQNILAAQKSCSLVDKKAAAAPDSASERQAAEKCHSQRDKSLRQENDAYQRMLDQQDR